MRILARVTNTPDHHAVQLQSGEAGTPHALDIAARPGGGSAVNGGELLMLALATCYCNDLYREAAAMGITLDQVEVQAQADFDGVGLAATGIRYHAQVRSTATAGQVQALLDRTDAVAEVHNTLRRASEVTRIPA